MVEEDMDDIDDELDDEFGRGTAISFIVRSF